MTFSSLPPPSTQTPPPRLSHTRTYQMTTPDAVFYATMLSVVAVSSEVGVFSSPNGKSEWKYHGIVVARGRPGGWDAGGVASPGAAVCSDGTVLVGYAAERKANGGTARAIGFATAPHPLGPFTKQDATPVASPAGEDCNHCSHCWEHLTQYEQYHYHSHAVVL